MHRFSGTFVPALVVAVGVLALAACGGRSGSGGGGQPGPQSVQGQVDLAAGTVTVTSPASHIVVTGTATDDGGGNATVNLTLTNNYPRLLFNLKAVIRALSDGTATGSGLFQGDPYVYFGPESLLVAGSRTRSFTVSGLAGTTFTFDMDLVNHKMLVLQNDGPSSTPALLDSSGTGERTDLDTDNLTAFFQDSNHQGALFSPDGRFLYLGNGNQPALVVVDTSTLLPILTTDLTGAGMLQTDGLGSVGMAHGLARSPNFQFLYTVLTEGAHSGSVGFSGTISGTGPSRLGATTTVSLVKIDRVTLAEVGRVQLFTDSTAVLTKGGKGVAVSRDGTRAAVSIPNAGLVFVVNLATMTIFDADLLTPGDQGFDVSGHTPNPRRVAFSPNNQRIFVAHSNDNLGAGNRGDLDVIDLPSRTISLLPLSTAFDGKINNRIGTLVLGPDDQIYYTHPFDSGVPGLSIFDVALATWTDHHAAPAYLSLCEVLFDPDGVSYWVQDSQGANPIFHFEIGTNAVIPVEATGLASFPGPNGVMHCAALSPF